jgi:hypothetical protein
VLGQKLGDSPARVGNYTRLRDDLKSNWARARADDDEETRARRKLILEALNRLALNTVGQRFGEDGFSPAPSWVGKVVANFAFVGVVGLVVALVSRQMLAEWLACQCPWTLFFGLPVILLSFLHVGWRWRCSRPGTVDAKASLKTVKRELVIAAWIDALHFWRLPAWATYVGALAAALVAVLLFLFLPGPRESTPMVEGYSVRYVASGETVHLTRLEAAEQGVEVQAGASVLITPDVMGDADARCTWYAIKGGRLIPEQGCAARYSAPLHETNDVISILIESECRTCEWWATVRVTIRQP